MIIEQFISNDPLFPNVKRKVAIFGANIQSRTSEIILDAEIHYFDENDENITHRFQNKLNWRITNNELTTLRDKKGNPLTNPKYNEETAQETGEHPHLKAPSFDYFFEIIKNPKSPNLISLLSNHILLNDSVKFFDQ